jgi:hypothetical protein
MNVGLLRTFNILALLSVSLFDVLSKSLPLAGVRSECFYQQCQTKTGDNDYRADPQKVS